MTKRDHGTLNKIRQTTIAKRKLSPSLEHANVMKDAVVTVNTQKVLKIKKKDVVLKKTIEFSSPQLDQIGEERDC